MELNDIVGNSSVAVQESATPTPGAVINLVTEAGKNHVFYWTAGENETVNISGTTSLGDELTLIILNDGVLPRTITLGTLLTGVGVIVGVLSLTSAVTFVSNGTNYIETSRTVGI